MNDPSPRISIAMATYNGSRFLEAQLASLVAQEVQPFELIVCDDVSTDGTLDLLRHFAQSAPFPVRIYSNEERLGFRANFLACAARCTGELISFCDQDDIWESTKLARIAACFEDPRVLLAAHGAWLIDAEDVVIGALDPPPRGLFADDPWALVYGFSETFRAELLGYSEIWWMSQNHAISGERMGHDRWILFVAAAIGKVTVISDRLVRYRQHGGNLFGAPGGSPSQQPPLTESAKAPREAPRIALQHRAAANRVAMLAKLSADERSRHGGDLPAMLASYRNLEQRLDLRYKVHASPTFVARVSAFLRLVAKGGYRRHDRWRFSRRALVQDMSLLVQALGRSA